ncbi:MAG: hypothetical protein FWH04_02735 [Oscillospiraceae bacterium]|nr:hypothetical protein [Oscillospiraceae bacterium]
MRLTSAYYVGGVAGFIVGIASGYVIDSVAVNIIIGLVAGFIVYKIVLKLEDLIHEKIDRPIAKKVLNVPDLDKRIETAVNNTFVYRVNADTETAKKEIHNALLDFQKELAASYNFWNKPRFGGGGFQIAYSTDKMGIVIQDGGVTTSIVFTEQGSETQILFCFNQLRGSDMGIVYVQKMIVERLEKMRNCVHTAARRLDPNCQEQIVPKS